MKNIEQLIEIFIRLRTESPPLLKTQEKNLKLTGKAVPDKTNFFKDHLAGINIV